MLPATRTRTVRVVRLLMQRSVTVRTAVTKSLLVLQLMYTSTTERLITKPNPLLGKARATEFLLIPSHRWLSNHKRALVHNLLRVGAAT